MAMTWHDSHVVQLECDHCGQLVLVAHAGGPHEEGDAHEAANPGHDVWSAFTVQTVRIYS